MTSIQLGGQKDEAGIFYMPINSASTINIDLSASTPPPRLTHVPKTRPSLSSLGTMSSPASSPPSTPSPGATDKLQMKQPKLSDADSLQDSAVGSLHEDGSHHSNESDVIVGTLKEVKEEQELPFCTRVALYKRGEHTVALKITCPTAEVGNDQRVLSLLSELALRAVDFFQKGNCDKLDLSTPQVCKLRLGDGRLAKEHLSELGRTLGQSLTVSGATCRKTPENGYVGILVNDIVQKKPFLTLCRQGVILVLHKSNKFAPVEEFSGQVCEHILAGKPAQLGKAKAIWKLLLKKAKYGHSHLPKDQLLSQTFLFDPTLTILEASKKSFVEIRDFALFD